MRICIAGSRDFDDYELLEKVIQQFSDENPQIKQDSVTIISGGARGADKLGERLAQEYGLKLEIYRADWDTYGKSAGYKRNEQMAQVSDVVFCFWDGVSKGTAHMRDISIRMGKEVHLIQYNDLPPWE